MAALMFRVNQTAPFDLTSFYAYVTKHLPLYACPKFLRVVPTMPLTATFKHHKSKLVKEGFHCSVIADPLYVMDMERHAYVPMTTATLQDISVGRSKL